MQEAPGPSSAPCAGPGPRKPVRLAAAGAGRNRRLELRRRRANRKKTDGPSRTNDERGPVRGRNHRIGGQIRTKTSGPPVVVDTNRSVLAAHNRRAVRGEHSRRIGTGRGELAAEMPAPAARDRRVDRGKGVRRTAIVGSDGAGVHHPSRPSRVALGRPGIGAGRGLRPLEMAVSTTNGQRQGGRRQRNACSAHTSYCRLTPTIVMLSRDRRDGLAAARLRKQESVSDDTV